MPRFTADLHFRLRCRGAWKRTQRQRTEALLRRCQDASFSSSRASSRALVASVWDSTEAPPCPAQPNQAHPLPPGPRINHCCYTEAVTFPLCLNRLLSVSLNAGKRVFYVALLREAHLMRRWQRDREQQVQFIVLPLAGTFNCPALGHKSGCVRH